MNLIVVRPSHNIFWDSCCVQAKALEHGIGVELMAARE
jgi:hypothetical protein